MTERLEQYAAALAASPDYRVLRRLQQKTEYSPDDTVQTKLAIAIDCETTGTDLEEDEILEIGAVKFSYDDRGIIHRIVGTFDQFRQPTKAEISDEITALTGIDFEMVRGKNIPSTDIENFIDGTSIILAHNSSFDRPRIERLFPVFRDFCWGDSYTEIPWRSEGHQSARLGDLLASMGLFHDGHKASTDAAALVEILSQKMPSTGKTALATLLERARKSTTLVMVDNARSHGDYLRKRGFHRHSGNGVRQWRMEASELQAKIECDLIREDCLGAHVSTRRVTAFTRFSERV